MKRIKNLLFNLLLFFMITGSYSIVHAYNGYQQDFDDLYPNSALAGNCQICHWPFTDYSDDFEKAGDDFKEIETWDSDGDGFDNITEINAGTFPGDVDSFPDTNTPPTANSQDVTTDENNAIEIVLTGEDADNDTLTFEVSDGPENGYLSGDAPNLTYTPNDGFTGNDNFTFTVNDGTVDSEKATVSISVVGTDPPPPDPDNYCESYGSDQSYEYIKQVDIGSFSNSSGAEGYGDFTSKIIDMTPGESTSITLTPEFISNAYTEYWTIWIDLNNDGDFEDSGETVFEDFSISGVTGFIGVKGSISIPLGTRLSQTRMRVSMQYTSYANSCDTFNYGEVEDYTVNIRGFGANTQ